MKRQAFTLIELLIVVAIIGVLAAIAVPNFLNAQTRAKVARVNGDLTALSTALESYNVDSGKYPPYSNLKAPYSGKEGLIRLTSPVAYIAGSLLTDPFMVQAVQSNLGTDPGPPYHYQYADRPTATILKCWANYDPGDKFQWFLLSFGPDKLYYHPSGGPAYNWIISYQPSNGVASWGNIMRYGPGNASNADIPQAQF
ncbi:MAG TPA: prepilin-type N-terminal cleavage/methylation domain-containing protein [bacterium]|mgnify:CR=1 FL=1|nr:prepilin-type N-terminal cleavage/methylation domain-containing protein [bacterium]HQQ01144.1 prepilin-type N-terminal cleavage/methylation domain-containing protein [bacterium]